MSNRTRSSTKNSKQSSILHRLFCCTPNSASPLLSPLEHTPAQSLSQVIADTNGSARHAAPTVRPHFILFECPWLPTTTPYDNHSDGFWDFPERAGWILDGKREHRTFPNEVADTLRPIFKELDAKYLCRQRTVPHALLVSRATDSLSIKCFKSDGAEPLLCDEVAFLQAWLFFGVHAQANTITGLQSDPVSDFAVKTHADGINKTLSTSALDVLPHRWAAALNALNEADRAPRWNQLLQVVQHATSLQTVISTHKSDPELEPRALTYDECKVLLSIRILFRAVLITLTLCAPSDASLAVLEQLLHPALAQAFPAGWDELKDFSIDEMRASGWCASECQLLERYDGAYNFFAVRLSAGRLPMDHTRCSDWACVADHVDEGTYQTTHVEPGCRCGVVEVRQEELCAVLDRGKVPRIVISKDLKIAVSDSEPYAAISHVWAHGLGNPKENSLPRCQVQRLVSYMSGLQAAGVSSIALWMDTLCVPVKDSFKSYRKQAIKLMSETYRSASAVLVLDRELQKLDIATVSLLEQDILTGFISWSRRLWTLQEAALAKQLYVQTLRAPHKLEAAAPALSPRDRILARISFREDIAILTRDRTPSIASLKQTVFESSTPTKASPPPASANTTTFQRLAQVLQHRTTSKPEDEPVILATMLGLQLDTVVDAQNCDRDARMGALLALLRDLPADVIFAGAWPGERCVRTPFRWAPRSLLGFPRLERRAAMSGPGAVCDERGLHASYDGLILEASSGDGRRTLPGERWYAIDGASGMKYEFRQKGGCGTREVPERCALLFRAYMVGGDTAVASIELDGQGDGQGEMEVTVVGHWVMVASGAGLQCAEGALVLEGRLAAKGQKWLVT